MLHKKTSRFILITILIALFVLLFVSGCKIDSDIDEVLHITATPTTPTTPTPTPRRCDPNISYVVNTPPQYAPLLLVVLFNPHAAEGYPLQYANGLGTSGPLDFIRNVLPNVLYSGDQYGIFELGYKSYEAARVDRYSVAILPPPPSRAMYKGPATITPINTPKTFDAMLLNQQAQNIYTKTLVVHDATATEMAFIDVCGKAQYVTESQATNVAWEATQTQAGIIVQSHATSIENNAKVLETPFSEDAVYDGLSHATIFFNQLCSEYSRCVLLIISDMEDWRAGYKGMIEGYDINLTNVEVISVIPNCKDIFQPNCQTLQNTWQNEFKLAHAKNVVFINGEGSIKGEGLESYLITNLRGDR